MKFKKLEAGRSMVEMLGVLAIIGVLSVGGIAGYSLSMRRHRANGVADIAAKYALVLYNSCQQHVLAGTTGPKSSEYTCLDDKLPSFEEADVGALPSGVNDIRSSSVDMDNAGGDEAAFVVYFDDTKLCQAVASVMGKSCTADDAIWVKIKQN